jgi:ethanolamine utilization protein EutA (predicted chaperonin)
MMARAKAAVPEEGYATDFVSAIAAPHLEAIAESGGQHHVARTLHEQRVPEHLA